MGKSVFQNKFNFSISKCFFSEIWYYSEKKVVFQVLGQCVDMINKEKYEEGKKYG